MSTREQIEQVAAAVGHKATLGGSAVASFFGWANEINLLGWLGLLVGICGMAVNWYYKHKHDKRAERALEAEVASQKSQGV